MTHTDTTPFQLGPIYSQIPQKLASRKAGIALQSGSFSELYRQRWQGRGHLQVDDLMQNVDF
jgi:hypothetical protein